MYIFVISYACKHVMHTSRICGNTVDATEIWWQQKTRIQCKHVSVQEKKWQSNEENPVGVVVVVVAVAVVACNHCCVLRILTGFFAEIVWNELDLNRCNNSNNKNMTHACSLASTMPPLPCGLMKMQWTKPDFSFPFNVQIYTIVYTNFVSIKQQQQQQQHGNGSRYSEKESKRERDWIGGNQNSRTPQKGENISTKKLNKASCFRIQSAAERFPLHSIELLLLLFFCFRSSLLSIARECDSFFRMVFLCSLFRCFCSCWLGFCCCQPNQVDSSLGNIILCNISNVFLCPAHSRFHYPLPFALSWIFAQKSIES